MKFLADSIFANEATNEIKLKNIKITQALI